MQDFRSQGGVQRFVASVLATQDSIICGVALVAASGDGTTTVKVPTPTRWSKSWPENLHEGAPIVHSEAAEQRTWLTQHGRAFNRPSLVLSRCLQCAE